ncbi:MAG: FtsQ-type POTRA domain-containing protein [Desulfobacterales bacterium]|nr:FtsQ-type POTRA domain-containing protein [Desulfobacterales bacterium]
MKDRIFFIFPLVVFLLKVSMRLMLILGITISFVFCHDWIMQCNALKIQQVDIHGLVFMKPETIKSIAGVHEGMNIFSFNLSEVRDRLYASPWIANAEVTREVPSRMIIRIEENIPIACVDVGYKFWLNEQGKIFKLKEPDDTFNLPLIQGFNIEELDFVGVSNSNYYPNKYLDAVLDVLKRARIENAILPINRLVKIYVDQDIGLSLEVKRNINEAQQDTVKVNLGFDHYEFKYLKLKQVFDMLTSRNCLPYVYSIDLNNMHRVVISPVVNTPHVIEKTANS